MFLPQVATVYLRVMSTAAGLLFLLARVLYSVQFGSSAVTHVRSSQMFVGFAKSRNVPVSQVAGWPSGIYLGIATISLLFGVWPDVGALLLGLWCIPTAVLIHNFWTFTDANERRMQRMNFVRNVTYVGAALGFLATFEALRDAVPFSLTASLIHL
jgi:putative oxidoreductase